MGGVSARDGSRLEVDDERFCKRCGYQLPDKCFEIGFHPLGGDEPPELCGRCLAKAAFEEGDDE